jgi:hypothetical protein
MLWLNRNKYGRAAYTAKIRPSLEKPTSQDALQGGVNGAVGVRYHSNPHPSLKSDGVSGWLLAVWLSFCALGVGVCRRLSLWLPL